MTVDEIKKIVSLTVDEMIQRQLLYTNRDYRHILKVVDAKLYTFFSHKGKCPEIGTILRSLSNDPYIDVIFFQYRDRLTMEEIAEEFGKDVSTIKRNKKRIVTAIYKALEEV